MLLEVFIVQVLPAVQQPAQTMSLAAIYANNFHAIYAAIAVAELSAHAGGVPTNIISKPLILPSIIAYYLCAKKSNIASYPFTAALVLCWLGDVLLLARHYLRHELLFIGGLGSFLVAHLLFIFCSIELRWTNTVSNRETSLYRFFLSVPAFVVCLSLVRLLLPHLGDLTVPVIAYAVALLLMVVQSTSRLRRTSEESFWTLYSGTLVFMVSDSLLAINMFYTKLPFAEILIMSTYIAAIYLIVKGVLVHPTTPITLGFKKW